MLLQRLAISTRAFSTSVCVQGKRSREPFDRRFPVTGKHGTRTRKGGSPMMEKFLAVHNVQPTGYFNKQKGQFHNVPEMIPEFVVPDLTDFPLKPYVSYKVSEIHQSKMTARDLFQATYTPRLQEEVKDGKIAIQDGQFVTLGSADGESKS